MMAAAIGRLNKHQRDAIVVMARQYRRVRDDALGSIIASARESDTVSMKLDANYEGVMRADFCLILTDAIVEMDDEGRIDFDAWERACCMTMASVHSLESVSPIYVICYIKAASEIISLMEDVRELA